MVNGQLDIDSVPGQGTKVIIRIPIVKKDEGIQELDDSYLCG